jgi:plasmid stabilization system protein ParE
MQVRFAELARQELTDARAWYEAQQSGLGVRFNQAVRQAVGQISRLPLLYPIERDDIHRYVLTQFPYTLRYIVRGELLVILTVSHHHRAPDYWVQQ